MIYLKEKLFEKRFVEYTNIILEDGYRFDQENTAAIQQCTDILRKNRYGIMLIGNPGSGKTLFFDIAHRIIAPHSTRHFVKKTVLEVVLEFNRTGEHVFSQWKDRNVLFDDLYKEDKGHFYSDNKVEVFERFINLRYNLFRSDNRILTHFTTNHSRQELLNRYGLYCMTRLEEMCEMVKMGESREYTNRRAYKNFISLPLVYYPKKVDKEAAEWAEFYNKRREIIKNLPKQETKALGIGTKVKEYWNSLKPQGV